MLTLGIAAIVAFGIVDQGEVNAQSVTGAICVYLLLGLAFTFVYGALAALDSGPFFAQGTDGTLALRLYYSYITLTTVGYGDYTLGSNAGHMLAIIEALAGQLYLVTVVALLVSRIETSDGGGADMTDATDGVLRRARAARPRAVAGEGQGHDPLRHRRREEESALARLHRPRRRDRFSAERSLPTRSCGSTALCSTGWPPGRANAMAEVLRGRIGIEGELEPLILLQRAISRASARKGEAMSDEIKILDGNTFVVSDSAGDIEASATDPTGLFSFDTRFLSHWVLTVNGERLTALSTDDLQYFETRFFLIPGAGAVYQNSKQSVIRTRAVADGFHEQITVLNHDEKPFDLTLRLEAASDFADLFEVKDALEKQGKYSAKVDRGRLVLGYRARDVFEGRP